MLKGVLFDYDGTLVDSEKIHFQIWNEVLRPYGVQLSIQEYKEVYVGRPTPQNAEDIVRLHRLSEDPARLVAGKQAAYQGWLQSSELPFMAYAQEAIAFFRERGMKLAVVTGSAKPGALLNLERSGLLERIDALVTRDDVVHSKPHPESYLRALSALDLAAPECIAFEDTEPGVRSAKAAELACYAVRNEFSRRHDFSLADRVFDDLQEAIAWVAAAHGLADR